MLIFCHFKVLQAGLKNLDLEYDNCFLVALFLEMSGLFQYSGFQCTTSIHIFELFPNSFWPTITMVSPSAKPSRTMVCVPRWAPS